MKFMNSQLMVWIYGFIGVLIFAGSLPATRIAVMDLNPWFLTGARAVIAGIAAIILLKYFRVKPPEKQQWISLVYVALGVVIGFPLLTALALQYISAAYSIVFVGLLPLSTAIFAVLLGGERPGLLFWVFAVIGSCLVILYIVMEGTPGSANVFGIFYMLGAIIACGFGYAEGGKLSRTLEGWQVICWALIISLPFMILLALSTYSTEMLVTITQSTVLALLYVSFFSMLIGFFFWYYALAQGGIATIGQLQLLQPLFGLGLAAWLLHEAVSWFMLVLTLGIICCVACAKKFA